MVQIWCLYRYEVLNLNRVISMEDHIPIRPDRSLQLDWRTFKLSLWDVVFHENYSKQIISLILVPWYPFIKNEDYYIHFNMIRDEDGSIKLTPSHPILLSVQPIQFRDFSLSGITIWCPTLSRFWCKIARWRYLLQQSSSTFKLIQDFFNLDRNI